MSKSLSVMVGKHLRWDRLVGEKKVLLYLYTLTDREASEINGKELHDIGKPGIVKEACGSPTAMKFMQNGVEILYRYHGKGGKEVTTVTVRLSDCS